MIPLGGGEFAAQLSASYSARGGGRLCRYFGVQQYYLAKKYICVTIWDMKIIDAHSHIGYITHKIQSDVVGCVVCATQESQWKTLIDIIDNDDCVYGAFGVLPWVIDSVQDDLVIRLEAVLKTNRNFMVGEIGLDKYKPNMDRQIEIFQKQFDVAIRLRRSVFVHCVGAWDKII